ncbi:MAG: HD domain-containing protein [Bacillota bacterium]
MYTPTEPKQPGNNVKYLDSAFAEFYQKIRNASVTTVYNLTRIEKAYQIAKQYHGNSLRKSGELYLYHPLEVATIVFKGGYDTDTIIASLLHDALEDTKYTEQQMRDDFGDIVLNYVKAVTEVKATIDKPLTKTDIQQATDKHLYEMGDEYRFAFFIKFADRVHNLFTIKGFPSDKIAEKVRHTKDVLLPACKYYHCQEMYDTLSDACLYALNPDVYESLHHQIEKHFRISESDNAKTIRAIKQSALAHEIDITFTAPTKPRSYKVAAELRQVNPKIKLTEPSLFSYYKYSPKSNAFIIFDEKLDASQLLSEFFRIISKFMYHEAEDSTHLNLCDTKPILDTNNNLCIVDLVNQYGNVMTFTLISRDNYATYRNGIGINYDRPLYDPEDVLNIGKSTEVLTRNGEKISLAGEKPTALDFAFLISTDLAVHAAGVKINNNIADLKTILKEGQRIEILTSTEYTHSIDWFLDMNTRCAKKRFIEFLKRTSS